MQIPFCGPTYLGRSTNIDSERCVNFFPEIAAIGTEKTPIALVGTPGTKTFCELPSGEPRCLYNQNGKLISVVGNNLYHINSFGTPSVWLGRLEDSSGEIYVADNGVSDTGTYGGNQIMMLSNGIGYIYNIKTEVFSKITDTVFLGIKNPTSLTFQDGYFIVSEDSQKFYVSDAYDGNVWRPLAWNAAITTSDNIVRMVSVNQTLYAIKNWSTEAFQNVGVATTQGSPFSRVSGAVFPFGTVAKESIAYGLDSVFFLANQGHSNSSEFTGVVMMQGYNPVIISTPCITYKISKMSTISDARGYFYSDEGHGFYVLTFPTEDVTLCYDVYTKMWHERSTSSMTDSLVHRHLGQHYTNCYNKHLITDYRSSKIMEMSTSYFSDDGFPIISERISPILFDDNESHSLHIVKLCVEIEGGVGDSSVTTNSEDSFYADGSYYADGSSPMFPIVLTPAAVPTAWLSWSNDSGHTWSGEYEANIGKMGEYKTRLVWRRLGRARNRTFRLRIKTAVKKVILDSTIEGSL